MAIRSVAVLTATSGRPELARCVGSVAIQATSLPIRHYLMTDAGVMHAPDFMQMRRQYSHCSASYWDAKAGRGPEGQVLEGRRLYAAAAGLVDEDAVLMLNDDDWFEADHIQSLVDILDSGKDWAFSLRKIHDKNGSFLFDDDCEALGLWPVWNAPDYQPDYLVEHSAFCLKREVFQTFGPLFNHQGYGVDRLFTKALQVNMPNFGCSLRRSLCYSLGGTPESVKADFFIAGNAVMRQRYPEGFPWREQVQSSAVL